MLCLSVVNAIDVPKLRSLPMFSVILIGVAFALILLAALALLVFYEVAFTDQPVTENSRHPWQPPFLHGQELKTWAARMATSVTEKWLAKPRNKTTALGLAREVSNGVNYAIQESENTHSKRPASCPSCKQRMIGVTPPEALAISNAIRTSLPKPIAQRIHDQSVRNAETVADLNSQQYLQADVTCPLWDRQTSCLVFESRPLHCRGCCSDKKDCTENQHSESRAFAVGSGTEAGLSQTLQSAGLDGSVYELNSALATALENPNAAKLWIEGNSVFDHCKRCS